MCNLTCFHTGMEWQALITQGNSLTWEGDRPRFSSSIRFSMVIAVMTGVVVMSVVNKPVVWDCDVNVLVLVC